MTQTNRKRRGGSKAYGVIAATINAFLIAGLALVASLLPANTRAAEAPQRLLIYGDSLSAGFGLPADQGFTARLQAALDQAGYRVRVINGGQSGDTSAGGLARLDWSLGGTPGETPDFAILELGANDGLRALDPKAMAANLDAIIGKMKQRGIKVLLAGMYAPRNLGPDYYKTFDAVFPELAAKHAVPLFPFFLDGVAGDAALNQADGIHPNARGVDVIVAKIMPYLTRLLEAQVQGGLTGR
jgi:acyl-CoA thioesterase-1